MVSYFEKQIETLPRERIEKLQLKLLKNVVKKAVLSHLYSKKLKNFKKVSFRRVKDIQKLPFTTKTDLLHYYPYGTLVITKDNLVELHTSSGTTTKPVPSFFTKDDLLKSSKVIARTWWCNGVRRGDIVQLMASYGLFSGGMLNHYALIELGAFVIPSGILPAFKQLTLVKDFGVNILAGVMSYYLYLINYIYENDIKIDNIKLCIVAGEPYSEKTRKFMEKAFNSLVFDQYGLAEINTGLAGECEYRCGLHIQEDYVIPEVINPKTGEVLGEGEEGELVLTTLQKEASPIIRYRTGDLTKIFFERCPCGRTIARIGRIKGRLDDVIFYKGIKLYPSAIEDCIHSCKDIVIPGLWQLIVSRKRGEDTATLRVVGRSGIKPKYIKEVLSEVILSKVGIKIKVNIIKTFRVYSKIKRVIDERGDEYSANK